MLTELASREKVIGVKQSARAIRDGRAQRVFLACDADELVLEPIRSACGSLPVEEGYTMAQLGRACGISVGAAAVTDLNQFGFFGIVSDCSAKNKGCRFRLAAFSKKGELFHAYF